VSDDRDAGPVSLRMLDHGRETLPLCLDYGVPVMPEKTNRRTGMAFPSGDGPSTRKKATDSTATDDDDQPYPLSRGD